MALAAVVRTRAATYALAAGLGLTLDLSGALHVYGLGQLSQLTAAAAALLLVGIAGGWLLLALHAPPSTAWRKKISGFLPRRHEGTKAYADENINFVSSRLGGKTNGLFQPRCTSMAERAPNRSTQRALTLLMLLAWLATARDLIVFLAPERATAWAILAGAGALVLALAVMRPPAPGWLLAGAGLLGAAARIGSFASVPIEPARGDMLPLAQQALGNVLAGHSPYTRYFMPWELPLTYLPVTWLAYLPPYLLGLDIRFTNLLAELLVGAALIWLAATLPKRVGEDGAARSWRDEPGLLLWAWVFLQPTSLNWSLATTAPVLWALLALLLALTLGGRSWAAAIALGLCAAASPLAALVAPFVLLRWSRSAGWPRAALLAGVAGAVAAALILPFLIWSPQEFVYGSLHWFNDNDLFPRLRWELDQTWARMVGFSGIFWRHELVGVLKPLQALLLAGLIGLYWRVGAVGAALAPLVAAAFLLFTVFNPVLWPYLYNPALIAALVAAVLARAER